MDHKKGEIFTKMPYTEVSRVIAARVMDTDIVAIDPEFIPEYESEGAACCDLKANIPEGNLKIGFLETVKIDCGFKMAVPAGFEAQIRSRSGHASRNVIVTNSPGTIDDDYRKEIKVLITNLNQEPITIEHKQRIAQMKLSPVWKFNFIPVNKLNETKRGEGGFGSTGDK